MNHTELSNIRLLPGRTFKLERLVTYLEHHDILVLQRLAELDDRRLAHFTRLKLAQIARDWRKQNPEAFQDLVRKAAMSAAEKAASPLGQSH